MSVVRKVVSLAVASAMASASMLATVTGPHPALAAEAPGSLTKSDYDACQSRDEQTFRATIENVTHASLKRSLSTFNYAGSVSDAWRSHGMDEIIDKRVDSAVTEIGNERSWAELLQSLADSKKAEELATAVAERVYRSDAIKTGIETVAADVGRTLGMSLEFASQDAAEPAITCLRAFLGPRYGETVASAVTSDAEKEFGIDAAKGRAGVSTGAVLQQSSGGLTGAAILLVRRQLANMAARISQRIVGSVLSKLVSVAAGGVGAVLIAKDIWELRSGVLPIIATEMKSKATKDLVKAELAKSIGEQIGEHLKELAAKSAGRIVEIWQEFRRAHAKALELAERDPKFRAFLDGTAAKNLPRLDEVVGLIIANEGGPGGADAAVLRRLADGTLDTAVSKLTPDAMTIARDTRSLDMALKWNAVASDLLPRTVEYEIHKRASADDFNRTSLSRLLSLEDKLAISRLASLKPAVREPLFELDAAGLKALARSLPEAELTALSGYLNGLERKPRERILKVVSTSPQKIRVISSDAVRNAILSSRDQAMAVDMMLREGAGTAAEILADFQSAFDGRIAARLLLDRHPFIISLSILPALVILLLFWRVFGTRRRPTTTPPARKTA